MDPIAMRNYQGVNQRSKLWISRPHRVTASSCSLRLKFLHLNSWLCIPSTKWVAMWDDGGHELPGLEVMFGLRMQQPWCIFSCQNRTPPIPRNSQEKKLIYHFRVFRDMKQAEIWSHRSCQQLCASLQALGLRAAAAFFPPENRPNKKRRAHAAQHVGSWLLGNQTDVSCTLRFF